MGRDTALPHFLTTTLPWSVPLTVRSASYFPISTNCTTRTLCPGRTGTVCGVDVIVLVSVAVVATESLYL